MARLITVSQLHWAAGFLEGEGSFGCHGGTPRVSAAQVQKEPLERLQAMFGGGMYHKQPTGLGNHPIWTWVLNKRRSASVMMTLYALMSPRRQDQIRKSLELWKAARSVRDAGSGVCLRGHVIAGENAQKVKGRTYPRCRQCHNDLRNARRSLRRGLMTTTSLEAVSGGRL